MYIGIGLLTASISFILYHRFFSSSSSGKPYPYSFDAWKRTLGLAGLQFHLGSKPDGTKASKIKQRDDDEDHSESEGAAEKEASAPRIQDSTDKSSLPSFALTFDDEAERAGAGGMISHDAGSPKTPLDEGISISRSEQSPPQPMQPPGPHLQTGLSMPPPARPASSAKRKPDTAAPTSSALMPPPSLQSSRTRPTTAQQGRNPSLLPPPSSSSRRSPSTLLQPPLSRQTPALPAQPLLATSTLPNPLRPSKKVLLEPGHSPLDWALLTKHPPTPTFLRGASLPPSLIKVSPAALRAHNGRRGADAWGVWQGKVYNLTPYLKFHPGGVGELLRAAGKVKEGERLFMEVHPWVSWEGMLGECLVGVLVGDGDGDGEGGGGEEGGLEDMD